MSYNDYSDQQQQQQQQYYYDNHQQQPHQQYSSTGGGLAGQRPSSSSRRSTPVDKNLYQQQQQQYHQYDHQQNQHTTYGNNNDDADYNIDPNYDDDDANEQNYHVDDRHNYNQQQQQQNDTSYHTSNTKLNSRRNSSNLQQQKQREETPKQQQRYVDPVVAKLEEEMFTERMKRDDLEKRLLMFEEKEAAERLEDEEAHQRRILEMFVTAALIKEDRKDVFKKQLSSLETLSHPSVVEQLEKVGRHLQVERSVVDTLSKQLEARMHAIRAEAAKEREKFGFYRTMLIRRMRQLEEHCRMVCGPDHWLLRLAPNLADNDKPFTSVSGLKIQQTPGARSYYENLEAGNNTSKEGEHQQGEGGAQNTTSTGISPGLLQYPLNVSDNNNSNSRYYHEAGYQMSQPAGDFATKVLMGSVSPAPSNTQENHQQQSN